MLLVNGYIMVRRVVKRSGAHCVNVPSGELQLPAVTSLTLPAKTQSFVPWAVTGKWSFDSRQTAYKDGWVPEENQSPALVGHW